MKDLTQIEDALKAADISYTVHGVLGQSQYVTATDLQGFCPEDFADVEQSVCGKIGSEDATLFAPAGFADDQDMYDAMSSVGMYIGQ